MQVRRTYNTGQRKADSMVSLGEVVWNEQAHTDWWNLSHSPVRTKDINHTSFLGVLIVPSECMSAATVQCTSANSLVHKTSKSSVGQLEQGLTMGVPINLYITSHFQTY